MEVIFLPWSSSLGLFDFLLCGLDLPLQFLNGLFVSFGFRLLDSFLGLFDVFLGLLNGLLCLLLSLLYCLLCLFYGLFSCFLSSFLTTLLLG